MLQVSKSEVLKRGSDSTVTREDDTVKKVYKPWAFDMHGRIYRQMLFMQRFGPLGLSPKFISAGYNEITSAFCEGQPLNTILKSNNTKQEEILNAVSWAIFRLHENGYNHCDLNPDNILCLIEPDGGVTVRFVDAEYSRSIPDNTPCSESFDLQGYSAWMRDHFGHPYSASKLSSPNELFNRLSALLKAKMFEVTGSQANVPDRRYIYHSFDLPGLKVSLPEAQRDVQSRFDNMRLDFKGKTTVDVGANISGMSLEAAKRGARVRGLELDAKRVELANKLAKFAGLDASFETFDAVRDEVPSADVMFFCAVDGYIQDKDALYAKIAASVRETLIFESNRRDKILNDEEWKNLWSSHGFKSVTCLGTSTDDVRVENHWRQVYRCDK